jgi:hypothetical protein
MTLIIFGTDLTDSDYKDLNIDNFFIIAKIKIDIDYIIVFDFLEHSHENIRSMITHNFDKIPEYKTCDFRGKKSVVAIFWNV